MKALLSLLSLALAAQATPVSVSAVSRRDSLNACLDAAALEYADVGSEVWESAILPHNLRVPVTPRAIVYATAAEHVQAAIACATESGLKVAAKSGGHSYASMGLGGEDGHVVIQLDRMYDVTLREDDTALVQAGARLGWVALELFNQGRRGISHGTCPSVGVAGHVLHGGFGFSSHTHGLALDFLIGANVVLANGTLVHASETENSDLFWALRGAGSSYGIVVEFEFKTFEVPEELTWFKIQSNMTAKGRESAVAGLVTFQELLENGDIDNKINMRLGNTGKDAQIVEVTYHGPREEAMAALEVLNEPLSLQWTSNATIVRSGNWIEHLEFWGNGDPLNITDSYKGHDNAYTSSLVTKHIPEVALGAFIDYWMNEAGAIDSVPWWLQMDVYGDPNSGVVAAAEGSPSSYAHRDKLWLFQFSSPMSLANSTAPGIEFVNGWMNTIKDNMEDGDWGRYANYIDSELEREVAQQQYWADNLGELEALKALYDPNELFYNPQSIDAVA